MTAAGIAVTRELDVVAPDGRKLRVYEAGNHTGTLVIVHHGTPGSGILPTWWVEDARARGLRIVGYDRPGYGGSDRLPGRSVADAAADSAAIADALGADRFYSWGVSGGGPHALACAVLLADRVIAAATLASVAPRDAMGPDWMAGMGQDNVDEFGAADSGESHLRPFLSEARSQIASAGPDGLADIMRSILPEVDVVALTGDMASFIYQTMIHGLGPGIDGWLDDDLAFVHEWGFELSDLRVPLLLVQGRRDLMVPFGHGQWLAQQIPGVTARLTDDDGHITLIRRVSETHAWLVEHR